MRDLSGPMAGGTSIVSTLSPANSGRKPIAALSEPKAIHPNVIVDRTRNTNWIGVIITNESTPYNS